MATITPARAYAELAAQHEALRGMLERCDELADELEAGRSGPLQLTREVARLRLAFEAHNRFEETLLRPMLLAADAFAAARIERQIEDHVAEHLEMRTRLRSSADSAGLREVVEMLRAHVDAEERYLMSTQLLRSTGG